jgi:hypothetical protein
MGLPMAKPRPRFVRVLRVRFRRLVRRWDRETPEWMRWLTPWGTSLALHALLLLALAIFVYVRTGGSGPDPSLRSDLSAQLRDDLTALRASDHAGDPFSTLRTDEPPSLSFQPDPNSTVYNLPELPPRVRLGRELQLVASVEPPTRSAKPGERGRGAGSLRNVELTAPFSGRRGDMKAKLVLREGGSVESEKAVETGLDWLARHQRPDGSWALDVRSQCRGNGCPWRSSINSDTAATGLALLPFLAAGHSHAEKGRYQLVIQNGLRWLVKHQKRNGDLYVGGGFNAPFYSHAIGSMALCESYGITKDAGLKGPAQRAINFIVANQNKEDGGWRYFPGQPGDTSVFGWQIFALRSANLAGLKIPKVTIRRCKQYLDLAAADPEKVTYSYRPGQAPSGVMTAEALLARQYFGWGRNTPALLKGEVLVANDLEQQHERNIYYWYYATQMLHNMHSKEWVKWNKKVREMLISTQTTGAGCDRGSWDPENPPSDRFTISGGRLYCTALSILTLEVYYRYLPLYRERDGEIAGDVDAQLTEESEPAAEPEPGETKPAPNAKKDTDKPAPKAKADATKQGR